MTAIVLVLSLGLGGWFFGHQIASGLGLANASPETKGAAPKEKADPNADKIVEADETMQKQLGLAFGKAETREIVKTVRVPGTVAFDERRVTLLKPRTKGRVLSLSAQPGNLVEKGQTLATLDASGVLDARNGLEAAKASFAEALTTETAAVIASKRAGALLKIGGVATAEVERRQVEEAKAHAALKSAQAQVDLYTAQYERLAPEPGLAPGTSAIVSPIAGVVVSAGITLGDVVDTNQAAFTIADPSRMLVLASVFGADVSVVKPKDKVIVDAPLEGRNQFDARILSLNAALDPLTNAAPARIEVENPQQSLRANMFVTVDIEADLGRRGVTIPAASVQLTEQGPIAFVRTAPDRFERRDLDLGLQRADWVEVKKGVADGETVATKGSFALKATLLRSLLGSTD